MKKIKITILSVIIIIIVLLILIFNNNIENDENINTSEFYGDTYSFKTEKVNDSNIFYSVSYCIEKYYQNLFFNSNMDEEMLEEKRQKLYDVLSRKYIEENNITENNVFNKVEEFENIINFTATYIDTYITEHYQSYRVKGTIKDTVTKQNLGERVFIVIVDSVNTTYAIYPVKNITKLEDVNIEKINNTDKIEKNNNNEFIIINTRYEDLLKKYVSYYKELINTDIEKAYEKLDKDYKNKRFRNIEEFKIYFEKNKNIINDMSVEKYKINNLDNYKQYIIMDKMGNYYIFKEYATMDFQMILDTYTIDTPEFLDKYEKANEQTKAGMNVEKFFEALNKKDYNYIYSHLADSFKNNYYKEQSVLEKYLKENTFEYNYITYNQYQKEGNVNIFKVTISNSEQDGGQEKNMTIMVKLEEGTNFVMSFSIE